MHLRKRRRSPGDLERLLGFAAGRKRRVRQKMTGPRDPLRFFPSQSTLNRLARRARPRRAPSVGHGPTTNNLDGGGGPTGPPNIRTRNRLRFLGVKPCVFDDAGRATSPARTRQLTSRALKRGPIAPMSGRHRKPTTSANKRRKDRLHRRGHRKRKPRPRRAGRRRHRRRMGPGRELRIRRQLGHQHRQRIPGRTAVLAEHLVGPRRRRVRAGRASGHQGRADRRRRARAGQPGQGRLADVRRGPLRRHTAQRHRRAAALDAPA